MDTEIFWNMIETARKNSGGNIEKQTKLLIEELTQLSEDEIVEFDTILGNMLNKAHRAILWDAAIFILCGCSEDGFADVRSWLVAQGKKIFEDALEDPDSLANIVDATYRDNMRLRYPAFASITYKAYKAKTGKDIPSTILNYTTLQGESHPEEELSTLFPRLAAKLVNCDEWWEAQFNKTNSAP